jgi:hypothetical protein
LLVERSFAWLHAFNGFAPAGNAGTTSISGLLQPACALIRHRRLQASF